MPKEYRLQGLRDRLQSGYGTGIKPPSISTRLRLLLPNRLQLRFPAQYRFLKPGDILFSLDLPSPSLPLDTKPGRMVILRYYRSKLMWLVALSAAKVAGAQILVIRATPASPNSTGEHGPEPEDHPKPVRIRRGSKGGRRPTGSARSESQPQEQEAAGPSAGGVTGSRPLYPPF